MTLLDRYIARQYLLNVAALFVILFSFVVTIDVSLNIDRFWRLAGERTDGLLGQTGACVGLIVDLWWPRLLQLFNMLLGIVLVGAMGFTYTQLVRRRELVAVLASGQSLRRVTRPVVTVAIGLTLLQGVNQELILPSIAPMLTRDHDQAGRKDLAADRVPLTPDNHGRLLYATRFDPKLQTLTDVELIERDGSGVATRRITAASASWDEAQDHWLLSGVRVLNAPGLSGPDGAALAPIEQAESMVLATDLDPTALKVRRYAGFGQNLSWVQISRLIDQIGEGDRQLRERLERIRFGRVSVSLSNILSLLITLPFFVTRLPGNAAAQSLKAAPIAIAGLMGGVLGASASVGGVPPQLGVFIPVMILLPIAIGVSSMIKT